MDITKIEDAPLLDGSYQTGVTDIPMGDGIGDGDGDGKSDNGHSYEISNSRLNHRHKYLLLLAIGIFHMTALLVLSTSGGSPTSLIQSIINTVSIQ